MDAIQEEINTVLTEIKTLNLSIVFYKRNRNTKKPFLENLRTQRTDLKNRLGVLKENQKAKNHLKNDQTKRLTPKMRKSQF